MYDLVENICQKKAVPSYSQEMPINTISAFFSLIQKKQKQKMIRTSKSADEFAVV